MSVRLRSGSLHTGVRWGSVQKGFTLLELMIVVAIVAILAAIATAGYSPYVIKSRRAAAASCLLERAQLMERYYTTRLTYAGAPAPAACDELTNFYGIQFFADPTARAYVIQAVPTARQSDAKCGTLSIDQKGARGASGTDGPSKCW
ncbi:prepilin-type N-terminal cleavage/methylation domain-containing protein [Xanthomonas nasturtii]|uniref:Prepilin-type N-terminal cleavage/methylation domain-containing protein n=2 Tax=Xanthomonas nasturtii TaxID=1843581 RepID=A0A3E1KEL4_9XANT|nr:type IV pilin protein [Xanthomonas nasturtii]MCL1532320.1 prepilin-type N-terminal cleavage/methylation domain-containing protein [Xanthomonas nasturtii]MCL1567089.1 prepilin-type N-terminal cleavage/methylation domain-containing protein [Xanthomonas nasturtii]MCL1571026.1 prepilin-type N-terminal cleavage/methylation domain-containing protein [Xanthomonas nasturtii]MCL1574817.1 prepilin-type N-terminal cleavage/methylation domain-containing protein [Xanthomonas nasturtii]MCL1582583.1 prepi